MFAGSRRLRRIRRNDFVSESALLSTTFRRLLLQIGGANIAGADRAVEPARSRIGEPIDGCEDKPVLEPMTTADEAAITAQLQRPPRGGAGIAYRCPCGNPAVMTTRPRLPDGSPFPTMYYLTCPRAVTACSSLEAQGLMADMNRRLDHDRDLAAAYRSAHEQYVADRERLEPVPEIAGVSAGGMPDRVKCLHALVAHALAAGEGVNPLGDEAVRALGAFWIRPCLEEVS